MVLFIFGLILVRTTFDPLLPWVVRQSDILLPFVVYLGQRRSLPEGLIVSLFASHLYSLCSAAPIGVFTTHYLILFCIARLLSYVTYANHWYSILLLMLSLSFIGRIELALIAALFGHGWGILAEGMGLWGHLLLNTGMGYLIYWALGTLDNLTFKAPRINIELSESEI
jgi:hypothetical protein